MENVHSRKLQMYEKFINSHVEVFTLFIALTSVPQLIAQSDIDLQVQRAVNVSYKTRVGKSYQAYQGRDVSQLSPLGAPVAGNGGRVTFFYNLSDDQTLFFKVNEAESAETPDSGPTLEGRIAAIELKLSSTDDRMAHLALVSQVELVDKDFSGFDFTGLKLVESHSIDVDYSHAVFKDADLRGAAFVYGSLRGSVFMGANLLNAKFDGVAGMEEMRFRHRSQETVDMRDSDFRDSNLEETEFYGVDLTGATFIGARFHNTNFRDSNLSGADFSGCDLTNVLFGLGVELKGTILDPSKLSPKWALVWTLINVGADGVELEGANLYETSLDGVSLRSKNLSGVNLSSASLRGADLIGTNLTGAKLGNVNFTDAQLIGAILVDAALSSADFTRADLTSANLTGAKDFNPNQEGIIFKNTVMPDGTVRTD
jgi:uncharacterized protein YjbI with pentapeptide repeats